MILTATSMTPFDELSPTGVEIGVAPSGSPLMMALRRATNAGSPSVRISTRPL